MNIIIVDYGIGNIRSIQNAFERLGVTKPIIAKNKETLRGASGLVLPGVGAFSSCSNRLTEIGLFDFLGELVTVYKKPILGICVGMQLMADSSTEGGLHKGLGWIPGTVERIDLPSEYRVPHVGWNTINIIQEKPIFSRVEQNSHFYFDHSYHFICDDQYVVATTNYGISITAAVRKENIFGVQFHPEKSSNSGLKFFRSYLNYIKEC